MKILMEKKFHLKLNLDTNGVFYKIVKNFSTDDELLNDINIYEVEKQETYYKYNDRKRIILTGTKEISVFINTEYIIISFDDPEDLNFMSRKLMMLLLIRATLVNPNNESMDIYNAEEADEIDKITSTLKDLLARYSSILYMTPKRDSHELIKTLLSSIAKHKNIPTLIEEEYVFICSEKRVILCNRENCIYTRIDFNNVSIDNLVLKPLESYETEYLLVETVRSLAVTGEMSVF